MSQKEGGSNTNILILKRVDERHLFTGIIFPIPNFADTEDCASSEQGIHLMQTIGPVNPANLFFN
jgi:hypothetical protein